jgi:uncharacterized protein YndB with AHSA1/START domain
MPQQPATANTFVIERHYPPPVERVFAAFAEPALKRRWFAVGGTARTIFSTSSAKQFEQSTRRMCFR